MDVTGLLKSLALLITGAVIPLIPVVYVALFGQQSLVDWYRKRATGIQGERVQAIAANAVAREKARGSKQTTSTRRAHPPLVARWGFMVFMLVALSLDMEEYAVFHFIGILLVISCIASPILLGCGLILAISGTQAAGFVLAGGLAALLVLVFLFVGFLVMGLLLAFGFELE